MAKSKSALKPPRFVEGKYYEYVDKDGKRGIAQASSAHRLVVMGDAYERTEDCFQTVSQEPREIELTIEPVYSPGYYWAKYGNDVEEIFQCIPGNLFIRTGDAARYTASELKDICPEDFGGSQL